MSLIFSTLNDKTPTDQRKCAIQLMNRFVIYFFISCLVNSETSLYQPAEKLKSWYDVYFRCLPVWCDQKLDYSSIKVPIMTWLKLNQSTAAQVASNSQCIAMKKSIFRILQDVWKNVFKLWCEAHEEAAFCSSWMKVMTWLKVNQSSPGCLQFKPFDTSHKLELNF